MTKDEIRLMMRKKRREMSLEEKHLADASICEQLINLLRTTTGIIAVYLPSPQEIDIEAFIIRALSSHYDLVAPRWNGNTYELAKLNGLALNDLRIGPMNIREPVSAEIIDPKDVSLWIIPGLAFSEDGMRLGYGGGWYDRFLEKASDDAKKIGVAYSFQCVKEIPSEKHDIKIDLLVSP